MNKLIICLGPSCSGKTTWSREYVKNNPKFSRFSIDEFKEMSSETGTNIISAEFLECVSKIIHSMLFMGDVIIDGYPLNIRSLFTIIKEKIEVEIRLFDVKFLEAVKRNQSRKKNGGHWLTAAELKRFHEFYREFITSKKFFIISKIKTVSVIVQDFQDANMSLLGEEML